MKQIVLATLNSSYQHSSFGLRYLMANLGKWQSQAEILEWTIQKDLNEIVDLLKQKKPKILGLGVYIWNTEPTLKLIKLVKQNLPQTLIVLGGPEVSFETETQEICKDADFVIKGEADFLFREFCDQVLGEGTLPLQKFISGSLPQISEIKSPYYLYNSEDIKNRYIYVEASRGCPYKCEYCLSSLDKSVRNFPLETFLTDMQFLLDQGSRQFKFIDRTFNLSPVISKKILEFFLSRIELGLFLHFEMVPDRLPDELKELIKKFPVGSLQFEIGIQTFNPEVAALVSRKNDLVKVEENFRFLKEESHVHIHADLIAGLPGENMQSFAIGFDRLIKMQPDEIQVGILKRLKGTPIIRHDKNWNMVYQANPPFQIISTKTMSSLEIEQIQIFSKFWDQVANRGHFYFTWNEVKTFLTHRNESVFDWFMDFAQFLYQKFDRTHGIPLLQIFESFMKYLVLKFPEQEELWKEKLSLDYRSAKRTDVPSFLKSDKKIEFSVFPNVKNLATPKRQMAHIRNRQES